MAARRVPAPPSPGLRVHPLFFVIGGCGLALALLTAPLYLGADRPSAEWVGLEAEKALVGAATLEDGGKFDEAAAAYGKVLADLEASGFEEFSSLKADLRARIKAVRARKAAVQTVEARWRAWRDAGVPTDLAGLEARLGEIDRILEACGEVRFAWSDEAAAARRTLAGEVSALREREERRRDWASFRAALAREFELEDDDRARWGPAIARIRAEFLPVAAGRPRQAAEEEIARLEKRGRASLDATLRRAEKQLAPVRYLEARRPRFAGCPLEEELDAAIRSLGQR
jgi:hypothetical protein